jgi:hypothetical protein
VSGGAYPELMHELLFAPLLIAPPDNAPAPAPIEPDPSRWERYVGAYRNGEQMAHIAIDGTNLSIRLGDTSLPLVAYRQDCYTNQEHGLNVGFVAEPAVPTRYLVVGGVILTDDPDATAAQLGPTVGLSGPQLRDCVQALLGSEASIIDTLQQRREKYGLNYVTVSADFLTKRRYLAISTGSSQLPSSSRF